MIRDLKQKSRMEIIMTGIVVAYILFLLYRIVSAAIMTADFPSEYREAANIAMTRAILDGVNIYSDKCADLNIPTVCYLYGPLMSLLAAGIAKLLPMFSVPVIHYIISFGAMIVSAFLIATIVGERCKSLVAGPCAFMMTIFCHWRYGYVYGAPDSLGLCLMIAALYALYRCAYNTRKTWVCNWQIVAAFWAVLTFFTKQYFIIVAITGGVYLLFVSKRKFGEYVISGIAMSAIAFLVISKLCPLYWTYSLYFLKGPGAGAAMGKTGKAYNSMQISYLGGMFLTLFLAMAVLVVILLAGILLHMRFGFFFKQAEKEFFSFEKRNYKTDITSDFTCDIKFYALVFSQLLLSGIILRYIGKNDGAFLSYYLQLFTPGLIMASVCLVDNFDIQKLVKNQEKAKLIFLVASYVIFIGYTIYKVEPRLIINKLSNEEMAGWSRAYEIADEYVTGENGESIYYVPPMNYHGYENNQLIYNDGQPFVFTEKFLKAYEDSEIAQSLYPQGGKIIKQHLDYREGMRQKILKGEYKLVMFIEDQDPVFTLEELGEKYEHLETISLRTGNWSWPVQFWVRK